jgi:hypothetical protein
MIVGRGARLKADEVQIGEGAVVDAAGKDLPIVLERHPGEVSKWGPFVALTFGASGCSSPIVVDVTLLYRGDRYHLTGSFVRGNPSDGFSWTEGDCILVRAGAEEEH